MLYFVPLSDQIFHAQHSTIPSRSHHSKNRITIPIFRNGNIKKIPEFESLLTDERDGRYLGIVPPTTLSSKFFSRKKNFKDDILFLER